MNIRPFEKIKNKWRDYWKLKEDVCPMWFAPITSEVVLPVLGITDFAKYTQDVFLQVTSQLFLNEVRDKLNIGDDWVPRLMPQIGTGVFASAFGAKIEFFPHCLPWAHPIINKNDSPKKAKTFKMPPIDAKQMKDVFEFTKLANFLTGGNYPLASTDLQGPADTVYLLWHPESLIPAMYESPKEVHYLMQLSTDYFIKYLEVHKKMCKEFVPFHTPTIWFPEEEGVCISDDILAVLNPSLWEEFVLPYINKVSKKFNGIVIHSCGDFTHQIKNLKKVYKLKGINFGVTETPFEVVWKNFGGKICVIPHIGLNKNEQFKNEIEFVEFVLKKATTYKGLCIVAGVSMLNDNKEISVFKNILNIMRDLKKIKKMIYENRKN